MRKTLAEHCREIASKGGSATGPSKARTSKQASDAAKARWAKVRAKAKKK